MREKNPFRRNTLSRNRLARRHAVCLEVGRRTVSQDIPPSSLEELVFSLSGALNAFIGRPNRKIPRLAPAAGVALVAFAAACGDAPSAPTATALAPADARSLTVTSKVSNTLATVTGLLWTNPVTEATATKVIGPAGGSFSIANGIQVTVPPNAVSQNVTFSVTRVAGSIVAYDFQPHGTTFAKPLVIMQPTLGTNLSSSTRRHRSKALTSAA